MDPIAPVDNMQDVSDAEMASRHRENVESAKSLLETIERVKAKQEKWQVMLSEAMAKDREEEMACERAFKRVALSQMQVAMTSSNGGSDGALSPFEAWLDSKGSRVGSSKIQSWYHDDALIRATPFCAVLPLPRDLTEAGRAAVEEEFLAMGFADSCFVENYPFSHTTLFEAAGALGILGKSATQTRASVRLLTSDSPTDSSTSTSVCKPCYLERACASSADLLSLVDESPLLKRALRDTPCLFLNDFGCAEGAGAAWRRTRDAAENSATALVRCIVIRGDLVAVEGVSSLYNQKSGGRPFDSIRFGNDVSNFVRSLTGPASVLAERSVQLMLTAHFHGDPSQSDLYASPSGDAQLFSFYLLDVSLFEGASTDHFQLNELLLLAEYRHALRSEASLACEKLASRLVVRMAGSPWADVSSAIARPSRPSIAADTHLENSCAAPEANAATEVSSKSSARSGGMSLGTVSLLMAVSAAVATGATVALSAMRKGK